MIACLVIAVLTPCPAQTPAAAWDARETRLANEYLALLVDAPEHGRVVDLLWDLYEKHGETKLLLENIRAQAAASKHPSVRLVEAHLLWKSGNLKSAASLYDDVLKAEPGNRFALRARADLAIESRQPEQALALVKRLAESLPDGDAGKAAAWMEYGNLALATNKPDVAAAAWESAAKLKPDDQDLARQVAHSLLRAGLAERAGAFFEKLADLPDPQKRLEALHDLARIYEQADQFPKADAALVRALALLHFRDGRYGEFFRQRVRLHERFGALDELRARLVTEGKKQPPVEQALSDLARFFEITVDADEQIQWLRELNKLAPDVGEYRWLLVRALLDHEGAVEAAKLIDEKLAGTDKDMPALVLLRCEADLRLGKDAMAIARLKALLAAHSGSVEVEKQVLAFAQEKALDEIIETTLHARLKRAQDSAEAVFELAAFYRGRRRADEMQRLLDRYTEINSGGKVRQQRLNEVAAFLSSGHDLDAAIITARAAAASPLAGREELLRLSELLSDQGETDEATKLLEQAWAKSTTGDDRNDVDERLLSILVGEKKEVAVVKDVQSGFQLPTIFTGAGFASDDEGTRKDAAPKGVTEHALKLVAEAEAANNDPGHLLAMRAAWWAYRADLLEEAYKMMRRVEFDATGKKRADLPLDYERLLLDIALADENKALVLRQLHLLSERDPTNRTRYQLRLSEAVMEGGQKAFAAAPLAYDRLLRNSALADDSNVQVLRYLGAMSNETTMRSVQNLLSDLPLAHEKLLLNDALVDGKDASAKWQTRFYTLVKAGSYGAGVRQLGERRSAVEEAAQILERAHRDDPDSEPLLSALTQCYNVMRQPEKALALWESAAKRAEGATAIPLLERQAELLLRLQRVQDFINVQADIIDRETDVKRRREIFKRCVERMLAGDTRGGELAVSVVHDRSKMMEQVLQERSRRNPFDGFYHEALALIHERNGDAQKAFASMKQAYYTAPDVPFSLDQLRAAALKVGDLKAAIYFQKQIAAAAPAKDQASESRQLVQLLEQTFQIAEADRVRRRLENRYAQDAKALGDLADHYRATGQDEAERRVYEQVVRVRPWDSRALLRLALKCLAVADDAAAEKYLRQLIDKNPAGKPATQPAVERWPLPLTDARRSGASDAKPVTDILDTLDQATGLEKTDVEKLRAWLSIPRAEFAELPEDAALVRLRAIEEMARLKRDRGGDALAAWTLEWAAAKEHGANERMWALYYAGAGAEFRELLRETLKTRDTVEAQFVLVWLTVKSRGMADALAWAREKMLTDAARKQRVSLLTSTVMMLADFDSSRSERSRQFRFAPEELSLFGDARLLKTQELLDITRKLEDRQHYAEALALGESLRAQSAGLQGDYAFFLSRIAESAERWDLQRDYLERATSAPTSANRYSGAYDPFLLGVGSLNRVAGSKSERDRVLQNAWGKLQTAPSSSLTSVRRAAVQGLAGADGKAADGMEKYLSGDFMISRDLGERTGDLAAQTASRNEEALHLRSYWEDAREIGASLTMQGLGDVTERMEDGIHEKWGGVMLGPRTGFEFNEWRITRLVRKLRETNYPNRLRLIREHIASVDMRTEASVEMLAELGARLEANGMARESLELYTRLPPRAPTNSEYVNWVLRACEAALEIEPGAGFSLQLINAEPPLKPPQPGDETLREKHARFLALAFDVEALRSFGFLDGKSRIMHGRTPPETPYLRELGLLLERKGDDAAALAAWERMHQAVVDNADKGLEPDAENCLHRARLLRKQGNRVKALEALRLVSLRDPLQASGENVLMLRATLAAEEGAWEEFRSLMVIAVGRKSVTAVLSLADDLGKHNRAAEALSFLTQAERTLKEPAGRFQLRLKQLVMLAADASWNPERGRPQISALFRAPAREVVALERMLAWLVAEAKGANAAGWMTVLRAEARSGADRPLAALALSAFATQMPDGATPEELAAAWRVAQDDDRVCLDLAARTLLDAKRASWAWQACVAAAEIPSTHLQSRKLPVMARVAAALDDRDALMDVFSELTRMPFPGGSQTVQWAKALEDADHPELARELLEGALAQLRRQGRQQPEILKEWISFLTRHKDFAAAELALVRESYLVINDAAQHVFELYRDWGKLDTFTAELRKFYFPAGVVHEARFLASGGAQKKPE